MLLTKCSGSPIQRAIAFLRSLGTNAHVWLPGANGVNVASLASNNYLLSDGSTGYSTVDGVVGLDLDGMGVTTNLTVSQDLSTWTSSGAFLNWNGSTATATTITTTGIGGSRYVRYACTPGTRVTFAATVVAGTTTGFVAVVFGTSGLGYISDSASSIVVSGAVYVSAIAPANAAYVELVVRGTGSGLTVGFTNLAATINTGTHLTQATTANKPLVRRGMYCLALWSRDISNVGSWVATIAGTASAITRIYGYVAAPDGLSATRLQITLNGGTSTSDIAYLFQGCVPVSTICSGATYIKSNTSACSIYVRVGNSEYTVNVTTDWTLVSNQCLAGNASTQFALGLRGGQASPCSNAVDISVASAGLFQGTFTAAQILAEGGIPTTTATAASNPSAGKYWWSFDGSNDSLLSGNLGITTACTIVIAGRLDTLPANTAVFEEDANGVSIYILADGTVQFAKAFGGLVLTNVAGTIVAGVPFVVTCRLSSGVSTLRKNGVQVRADATALTFSATTGARIGTNFAGTLYPVGGALGWVVPLPVALSDADCLTVERLVGSQFPGMATF